MVYLTVKEISDIWGISSRRVQILCSTGRVNAAKKIGGMWLIPKDTAKPEDKRKKTVKEIELKSKRSDDKYMETSSLRLGAVIAAGGDFKQNNDISPFLQIGNISLIRRIVITLQQAGVTNIVVITGYRSWEVEHHLANYGVIFLQNENFKNTDKFTSLKIGLQFLMDKCDKIFLTSLKIPMFIASTLKSMIQYKNSIVIPQYQGKNGHPLLLDSKIISDILSYQGEEGMRGAMKNCNCKKRYLSVGDEGVLLSTSNMAYLEETIEKRDNYLLRPHIQVKIKKNSTIFDERAKLLLFLIKEFHSVQNACKQMAISKGKAWDLILAMEKQLNLTIVERQQGGSRERKTKLTFEGEAFLRFFDKYERTLKNYADRYFEKSYREFQKQINK